MEMTRKAVATAHRNLSSRIERYLFEMQKADRPPCRREGEWLEKAVACLASQAFDEGERAMMWADVATRQPGADEVSKTVTVEDLRTKLAAIAKVEA